MNDKPPLNDADAAAEDEFQALSALDEAEAALAAESSGSTSRRLLRRRLLQRREREVCIDVYDGYGTTEALRISGRVYFKRRYKASEADDTRFRNLVNTSKQFMTYDARQVWVQVTLGQRPATEVRTDDHGIFEVTLGELGDLSGGIYPVSVGLADSNQRRIHAEAGQGHFIVHPADSDRVGIISDIDDTILLTEATRKMRMLKNIFLKNPLTQGAIPGMRDIYRAIHYGPEGDGYDATHYVSSSPAHLYRRISHFLGHEDFPAGSIDLKTVRLRNRGQSTDSLFDHQHYKYGRIARILETFPRRRFVLFGDSGEHDSAIYRRISARYPAQILAVYIHNVTDADPFHSHYQGQMLFSSIDRVRRDLLQRGLIYPDTLGRHLSSS